MSGANWFGRRWLERLTFLPIRKHLPPARAARNFVVVTDDRELSRRARGAGARVRSLREWWPKLLTPGPEASRERDLSPDEVTEWEALFSERRRKG